MSAERIAELAALGVQLWCEGDRLRCSAPPGVLTPAIADELRASKAELLRALSGVAPSLERVRDLPIPRARPAATYRLSPPQRRYAADFGWSADASWSTVVLQAPVPGAVDPVAFAAAFRAVCARHACLRTVFPEVDGERRQLVRDQPVVTFDHEDHGAADAAGLALRLGALRRAASQERWNTVDGPLGRLVLVHHAAAIGNAIVLHFHRIVMDGASVKLLVYELLRAVGELAAGASPAPATEAICYVDFSEWLNGLQDAGQFTGARDYWRAELAAPLPDPFGWNAAAARAAPSAAAGLAIRELPAPVVARLRALASERGWLFPMMLFAIYAIALRDAGAGDELVVDASLSGRPRAELRGCLGFLTNAAAIRIRMSAALGFAELVGAITRTFAAAEDHQYFQYNDVIDDLGRSRDANLFPLSGILFNTITFEISAAQRARPGAAWQPLAIQTRYGAMFYAMFHPEGLSLELTHRLALLDQAAATRILDTYVRIADRLLATGPAFAVGDALGATSPWS